MKKGIAILLMTCILFSVAGCSVLNDVASVLKPTEKIFSIDSYRLQITADSTFRVDTNGSFDLQITNGNAYVSVMAYKYIDLPEDITPLDVFDMQNEDIFSKRTNVATIEEPKTESLGQREITHALYSAEKDGVKNYYASYLVDIPEEETFAWVLVTATPSYLDGNREYFHNIVCSLAPIE